MTKQSLGISEELNSYLLAHSSQTDDILNDLAEETQAMDNSIARMQISVEQGLFFTSMVKILQPKICVEVGTFTGYSAICIARGLTEGGKLICCDINQEWTDIANRYWKKADLLERIELHLAPAEETLKKLDSPVDFAFIDADKGGYKTYYEEILQRLSPRGVIFVDNVFWGGAVADSSKEDKDLTAIKEFNDFVASDSRVSVVMLPIADGISMITKV